MKLGVLITLFLLAQVGCISSQMGARQTAREPQQAIPIQELQPVEKSFQSIMSQSSDGERSKTAEKFLERQRDFYFIADDMLTTFDAELEKLYQLNQQDYQLSEKDFEKLNHLGFQLRVAREFSERNLHNLVDIYNRALPQANDPSAEFHKPSTDMVNTINKWLKKTKKTDPAAITSLAQHLDDVNIQVKSELAANGKPIASIPSFKNFSKGNSFENFKNQMQNFNYVESRKQTILLSELGKEWLQYQADRNLDSEAEIKLWTEAERRPQALDTLYPDAGSFGYVTGNRFPTNTWAITLDDGPHPTHTPEMFNVLRSANMNATFFWLTQNLKLYPQYSEQAKQFGFYRGNHSYTHANLPKMNQAQLNHEINDAFDDFEKVVGTQPTLFRCPYGACGPMGSNIRQMIAARNALHIGWNVDSLDWQDKNPESIFQRARKQMEIRNHGIILFHDVHPQSVIALGLLTNYIQQKGYIVKPLPQIISEVREKPYASP